MNIKFDKPYTVEPYNTNNAWGFGGSSGFKYTFAPNLYLIIGRAGTRHRGTFPHTTLWHEDRRIVDLDGHGKKQNETINTWVNAIIDGTVTITEDKHGYKTEYKLP